MLGLRRRKSSFPIPFS
ncbi:hypothetical protein NGA_0731500 [Nannochloropsis gaditana CCMP526]|nr:hypothetical protein NGA_0731500 [Nannochloropsis gaditana CCMP526]EKU23312.1 hypothetical protein NGA_0731500 [Nannochloropsis gaditana CCMP526]|eukprot:XP_005852520.1 hypothetical protein NGA_0731500 [Nannochloropsis gaditana CCMP526]